MSRKGGISERAAHIHTLTHQWVGFGATAQWAPGLGISVCGSAFCGSAALSIPACSTSASEAWEEWWAAYQRCTRPGTGRCISVIKKKNMVLYHQNDTNLVTLYLNNNESYTEQTLIILIDTELCLDQWWPKSGSSAMWALWLQLRLSISEIKVFPQRELCAFFLLVGFFFFYVFFVNSTDCWVWNFQNVWNTQTSLFVVNSHATVLEIPLFIHCDV